MNLAEPRPRTHASAEGKWQVSVDGGDWPTWNRRGDKIYFAQGDTIMETPVTTGPSLTLGKPRELFVRVPLGFSLPFGWGPGFDVSGDEQRFVICQPFGDKHGSSGIVVVENWADEFGQEK